MTPQSGSTAGGTRITITLNTPLVNYTDIEDVVVRVGGEEYVCVCVCVYEP